MPEEIPQILLGVPVDRTVESGMHYVVLGRAGGSELGFRVRSTSKYEGRAVQRISKSFLMRSISRCREDPDHEMVWKTSHFRDWVIRYSEYCRENQISPTDTPAVETVKVSWYSLAGMQVKIFTDRLFPWQWFRKK